MKWSFELTAGPFYDHGIGGERAGFRDFSPIECQRARFELVSGSVVGAFP